MGKGEWGMGTGMGTGMNTRQELTTSDAATPCGTAGGTMITFGRIEVVNQLQADAAVSPPIPLRLAERVTAPRLVPVARVTRPSDGNDSLAPRPAVAHGEELYGRVRQDVDLRQDPSRDQPDLQPIELGLPGGGERIR